MRAFSSGTPRLRAARGWAAQRRRASAAVCKANPGGGSFRKNRIAPPSPADLADTPKEALIKTLGEVSKSQGRVSDRTNVVLGGEDNSVENWRQLDQKVNEYPCERSFKCVGLAEADFKDSMVAVVSGVIGSVHPEQVSTRPSSGGKYISVQIGPVVINNPDQVMDIFAEMKKDTRLKWAM